jgi:hypothetical protein
MIQEIEQTKEQKTAMYMKLSKKELVKMLIQCNDIIASLIYNVIPYISQVTSTTNYASGIGKCESCGCTPVTLYSTSTGQFCIKCKPKD